MTAADARKAAIDFSAMILFWSVQVALVVVLILHYWTWEQYASWLIAYTFLSLPFSPVFGRFLNAYRRLLRYDKQSQPASEGDRK